MLEKERGNLLCPSMMCAPCDSLAREVRALDEAGADVFHCDVMDGRFVPNFALGMGDIRCIRENTQKLVDVHLMVEDPGRYVGLFSELGVDILYVHPEADREVVRTLMKIRLSGSRAGIALNPGTSLDTVKELLSLVDYLMIMTVMPGFSGQKYLPFVDEKLFEAARYKSRYPFRLMVDGAISPETVQRLSGMGVDGFVLGTSALFGKQEGYATLIEKLRNG